MFSNFTNLYPISKTLRFELQPQGETLETIEHNGILEKDGKLAEDFKKVKAIADEWLKGFISKSLENASLSINHLTDFEEVSSTKQDQDRDPEKFSEIQKALRKEIVSFFVKNEKYELLGSAELIKEELLGFVETDEERELIREFKDFTTYFTGYHETRKNIYAEEEKATAYAFRIVHENLPIYLQNKKNFKTIKNSYPQLVSEIEASIEPHLSGEKIEDMFTLQWFSRTLVQSGIDIYNKMMGGETLESGEKIQGFNEKVNLFRQGNKLDGRSVPSLKRLKKQILGDKSIPAWVMGGFKDKDAMNAAVNEFYEGKFQETLENAVGVFASDKGFDYEKIFVKSQFLTNISLEILKKDHGFLKNALLQRYIDANPKIKNPEKKFLKKQYFAIFDIQDALPEHEKGFIFGVLAGKATDIVAEIRESFKLWMDENDTRSIKRLMDAILSLQQILRSFFAADIVDKDIIFYELFDRCFESMNGIVKLYNEVRNFITRKPYSTEKIKLNFENSILLDGWDVGQEENKCGILLLRDNDYYLGIMDKKHNKIFRNASAPASASGDYYKKMEYNLFPSAAANLPRILFADSNISKYSPSEEIIRIYKKDGSFKSGKTFNLNDMRSLIDFYKTSIANNEKWNRYGFEFRSTEEYNKINEFYADVERQGYKIEFKPIAADYVNRLVRDGKLYLFKIYSKDFSPYSKGRPNLHTLYFKALFNERNLEDVVFKLSGGGEIFYRKKSDLGYTREIMEKGHHADELKGKFSYPIIKDKRYVYDKFFLHVPIELNFSSKKMERINKSVKESIRDHADEIKVIGIDRGERNLLYLTVIDSAGNIVEQDSLNVIGGVNYNGKLGIREKERKAARVDWGTIKSIKELKEGYLSHAVHRITSLAVRHNAIIAIEDLNAGFKRIRQGISEKSVYQKFEKMLIDKLNYLVDKEKPQDETGGLYNALQLTNKFESFEKMGKQNGFMFFVPPWNTSNMDPATGFVNLFDARYYSVDKAKEFFRKFKSIRYNDSKNWFEFEFDYDDFMEKAKGGRTDWTVCTYGGRIRSFKNDAGKWTSEKIDLTQEFKDLFGTAAGDMKDLIVSKTDKGFFEKLLYFFRLTLQLRNSEPNSEIDYILSPVMNIHGEFFDSREGNKSLPLDADANGSYNIARKGLILIERIRQARDSEKLNLIITNKDWLEYAQDSRIFPKKL